MAQRKLVVRTGSTEDFFAHAANAARRLDRGEQMDGRVTLIFEDPRRMFAVLSDGRRRLMRAVLKSPQTIMQLTHTLKRDRATVAKDIRVLEQAGLLVTRREPNPGHGIRTFVAPVAARIELVASLA